ncbi:enoyl-CoA hydratase/isomerase family protein [Achromobacter insolitus]|jgi:enoyl-CoA hydratase|uniref:enoyl-CoA hydratase/isomerase family protein n=1 Tax=Achromobacter insolitus TaxID=217204 RepID=UPI0005376C30|nr:enoyl-CoA hydratase/isomerase family protein [Achromobacter insolitus]GLK96086.1 enoyl-CoA hydratase [Achromobacter xylosoxidans]APX75781.1 enoyl-CoA hydratase [Achromobacter insolitus]AVG40694.1 enoyl-CoA hydratase/isomerase family protein [Achromobacter insolitus]AXA71372.1 enoyl-CoA hydratase/isomerase family protein [Achromobacter insolitus]MCP1401916.1 enoyl-CoA hydratase [Achromobacter insolitus]
MNEPSILTDVRNRVGIITINRPKVHNALDIPTLIELERAFASLEASDECRVIVITGAGEKSFVAGGDLADLNSRQGLAHYQEFAEDIHRVFRRIEVSDKPTIAAVNGWALGGGTELLLAMDLRILADSAMIALTEINLGLFPGAGGTQRIIRQVAPCLAKELMFTGGRISADEAVRIGLANRAVPKDQLMAQALALAEQIAGKSPLVLKLLKRTLRDGADMPLANALAHEQAMIGLVLDTRDAHEGIGAFLEKRDARFAGQ